MKVDKWQRFALFLFFFSINFEVWDPFNTGGFFSISKLTGFIYFVMLTPNIKYFLQKSQIIIFLKPLAFFFIYLTVISIFHINSVKSTFFDFTLFQIIILFWFLMNHERKEPGILEKGLLFFVFGSITLAILAYNGIGVDTSGERISVFGDNQNNIGIRMSISSIIVVLTVYQNNFNFKKWRYLLVTVLPVLILLMVGTGSRVSVITFGAAMFVLIILIKEKILKKTLIWLFSGVLAVYGWKVFLAKEAIMERLQNSAGEGDLGGRKAIWQKVIPVIENNPLFGVGKTGYAEYIMKHFNEIRSPHNVILEVLAYSGVIGFILFSIFIYRLIKQSYSYYISTGYLLSLLLFLPVLGMIFSGHILGSKIVFVIFAYAASRIFYLNNPNRQNR